MASSKGRFQVYPLMLDEFQRGYFRHQQQLGNKVRKNQRDYLTPLRDLYMAEPRLTESLDTIILADEWNWLNYSDRHVVFPESPDVIEKLLGAKIDLANTAPIVMPHDTFVLAVPNGYEYNGMAVPSILVGWFDKTDRNRIVRQYTKDVFIKPLDRKPDDSAYENDHFLMLTYRAVDDELVKRVPEAKNQFVNYRCAIPSSMIPDVLRCKDGDEYQDVLGSFDDTYCDAIQLSKADRDMQFMVAKLVLMTGLYSHAFPAALKHGYPGTPPKFMEPKLHKAWNKFTIGMPSSQSHQNERNYHYRSWHFRQLMDPRYYKGEHKDKPIGSRVVFVKDSMVGREIDPETLQA